MPEVTPFEAALAELAKELIGGGATPAERTVPVPTQTLGGQRMRGARPMTPQERQMADNPGVQMARDAGAAVSSGINGAGFGLPGLALDYVAPNALAFIRENEALANPGIPEIARAAGFANAPRVALKALGGAYGLAAASDLGAFDDSAEAQGKGKTPAPALFGLTPDQMKVYLDADRRLQRGEFGSPAERRQLEGTMGDLRKLSGELQLQESSSRLKTQSGAEQQKQDEYDRAVRTAEGARDKELARDRRFSDTNTGKVWEATGGLAPVAFGALTGKLAKAAGQNTPMTLLESTLAGGAAANVPLAYNALFTEPDNPQRRGFEAYARELPPEHPRRAEFADYASKLPEANPVRTSAAKEFYDWEKLAERLGMGGTEGFLGGALGSNAANVVGRVTGGVGRLLRGPAGPQSEAATLGAASGGTRAGANALSGSPTALPGTTLEEGLASTPRQSLPAQASAQQLPPGVKRDVNGVAYDVHTGQKIKKRLLTPRDE